MSLFRDLNHFYVLFFIFGQGPYYPLLDPHFSRKKIHSRVLMWLPLIFLIWIAILCSMIFFLNNHKPELKSNTMVLHIVKCIGFVPNFIVIYSNLVETINIRAINDKLNSICKRLKMKLNTEFQTKKFKSACYRLIFVMIFVSICIYSFRSSNLNVYNQQTELAIFIMHLYKVMAVCHAIFYLNLFKFILVSINEGIEKMLRGPISLSQIILNTDCQRTKQHSINYFQQISFAYIKLWEVMKIFNTYCGWILIAIILDSTVCVTHAIYGFFLYFEAYTDVPIYISRKYHKFNMYRWETHHYNSDIILTDTY